VGTGDYAPAGHTSQHETESTPKDIGRHHRWKLDRIAGNERKPKGLKIERHVRKVYSSCFRQMA
jgi:hypothetical protein